MRPTHWIQKTIEENWDRDFWCDQPIVIGVSGGPDSMALLNALHGLHLSPQKIIAAHFNHGTRGEDSDQDEHFVKTHAERLGVRFISEKASCNTLRLSESALRSLRYRFLVSTAAANDCHWIATAHHADDQVETFFHHLIRGSGPSGLSGIPRFRALNNSIQIVRPMLDVGKEAILQFLKELNQPYRIDRTNESDHYTRNKIRNQLMPQIKSLMGKRDIEKRIVQSMELLADEHDVIITLGNAWLRSIDNSAMSEDKNSIRVPLQRFKDIPWPIVRHGLVCIWHANEWPLREMDYSHWRRLKKMIARALQTTHRLRTDLPGKLHAECRRGFLTIKKLDRNGARSIE